ncbi:MAG: hypothetical protein ACYSU8_08550, partial [Planctomycetota bacterium]
MKLMSPLKTPAKNTEQRIFKFTLFAALPLMAIVTAYLFISLNIQKNDVAQERIEVQSGNANKRMTIFFDPIHRDLGYLQARGNTKTRLDPYNEDDVRDFLGRFSEFYLQHVNQVILYSKDDVWVYSINKEESTGPEKAIDPVYKEHLDETIQGGDVEAIKWYPGTFDPDSQVSSILAATLFVNPKSNHTYVVAMDVDTTEFFSGLEGHIKNRLFLLSDLPGRLPYQFLLTDNKQPSIEETNDPIILAAYTQWKSSN